MSKKKKKRKAKGRNPEQVAASNTGAKAGGVLRAEPVMKPRELTDGVYGKELRRLQVELVKLQEWIKHKGLNVVVIFEGRDAAGKGGVIKRVTERLNPRICRIVALATPTEREKTQWYFGAIRPELV
jgi:polyphosphate kinase 2 (PPK2 family)